ncbi:hypothetical protein NLJ89_g8708 [Agrocybe chaxingu]|uniref:Methyltransferase-domain-containing protein n=1 Tax=Agrocybe chaxingu TaxID=84603 RepID=A0A9W8MTU2_9AGAR|nr:hypothetical protein NLJ89_g8708 [Agrocybe chaxingu]
MESQEPTFKGPIRLSPECEFITDADEEIFILYSEKQIIRAPEVADNFRGLGYLDSHKDVLDLKFELTNIDDLHDHHDDMKRKRRPKASRDTKGADKSIEIQLHQDKTALRSRKGDTGSVLWRARCFTLPSESLQAYSEKAFQHRLCTDDTTGLLFTLRTQSPKKRYPSIPARPGTWVCRLVSYILQIYYLTRYTATDIGALIPLIQKNIALNSPFLKSPTNISAQELDWLTLTSTSHALRHKIYDTQANPVDLLLAVDCRTAVLVMSELRAEDVMREFLEAWLGLEGWEVWRIPNDNIGKCYVIWVGWKAGHERDMFFYISFLRPPPLQSPLSGAIQITPQISNDLRTETFDSAQDLFYTWSLSSPSSSQGRPQNAKQNNYQSKTASTKLTTLRPSTAYKPIPVPLPSGVREGQHWMLTLTSRPPSHGNERAEVIDLARADVGRVPFSVMSIPVLFSARGGKSEKKQETVRRCYTLPWKVPGEGEGEQEKTKAELVFTEKTSFDLDKKIWDSGIGLSSWLVELLENPALTEADASLQSVRSAFFSPKSKRILELGTGIGVVSIALSVLRSGLSLDASSERAQDRIIATDISSAMPLLEENIASNSQYYASARPEALVLDWDDAELPDEVKVLGGLDAIVMADVSYNTASFPSLARTLSRLIRLGPKPPVILLGYKERDEDERTFWKMAGGVGIRFEKVGERGGAGGVPVEIWVGGVEE